MPPEDDGQLELFDLEHKTAPRPSQRPGVGRVYFTLRHDQIVLVGIGALIGLTVVFAFGVERGKQLSRFEGSGLSVATHQSAGEKVKESSASQTETQDLITISRVDAEEPARGPEAQTSSAAPREEQPQDLSGYAIQVVTYAKHEYAEKERKRLEEKGEVAFVRMYNDLAVLFVGPFETKDQAKSKLAVLRETYSDCFLKSL